MGYAVTGAGTRNWKRRMTVREAVIEAEVEMGINRQVAEAGATPDNSLIAAFARSVVRPGLEREFIEFVKRFYKRTQKGAGIRESTRPDQKRLNQKLAGFKAPTACTKPNPWWARTGRSDYRTESA